MRRGDVFWADLRPRSGSEQRGRRPVIVMSNDGFNLTATWRSLIVVPLSASDAQAKRVSTVVTLSAGVGGLSRSCVAVCHQVTTLDRAKLRERIGALPAAAMAAVESGLRAALDLD
ncbi:MAG: type II toxin-antitoxin system PemK/MazF family toxin [Candidatus Rokubacteria bacterium]|nr:type II toxin-antitoxin system PemK/MazF family toxin [Candidatus Rokubacteria bacterium]